MLALRGLWSLLSLLPHYQNGPLKFCSLENDLLLSLHGNCPGNKLPSISIRPKKAIREITGAAWLLPPRPWQVGSPGSRGRARLWLHHEATGRAAKCPCEGPCEGGAEETWSPPFEAPPKKVTWCSVPAPQVATAKGEGNGTNYPYKGV